MYSEVITLLETEESVNDLGDINQALDGRDVFAELRSVGMKEQYEAAAVGLKPEHCFRIADYLDYREEKYLAWHGKRYQVFRVYRTAEGYELDITVTGLVNRGGMAFAGSW